MRAILLTLIALTAGCAVSSESQPMSDSFMTGTVQLSEDALQRGVIQSFLATELGPEAFEIDVSVTGPHVTLSGHVTSERAWVLAPILTSNLFSVGSVDASTLAGPTVHKDPFQPDTEQRLRDALARELGSDRGLEVIVVHDHALIAGTVPEWVDLIAVDSALASVPGIERATRQVEVLSSIQWTVADAT